MSRFFMVHCVYAVLCISLLLHCPASVETDMLLWIISIITMILHSL